MGWDGKTPRARSHPPRKCYDNNTTQTHPKGMQLRHGAGSVGADRVRQREGELGAAVHHDEEMRLALHFDDGTWNVLGSGEGFLALCCCCCCGRQRQNLQGGFPRTRAAPAPPAPRPPAEKRCQPPPVTFTTKAQRQQSARRNTKHRHIHHLPCTAWALSSPHQRGAGRCRGPPRPSRPAPGGAPPVNPHNMTYDIYIHDEPNHQNGV